VPDVVVDLNPARLVGVDWAAEEHAVCVVDGNGRKLASFTVPHCRDGLVKLVKKLAALGPPAESPVAVERPDGRLVDCLLEAGHPVVPVSPNAIKAWRESEVVSGAKSDPGDAEVWAADVYRRAVARGCDHPHAVRVLARAWVRVIYRCWVDGKPYDPARHGGAVRSADALTAKEAKNLAA